MCIIRFYMAFSFTTLPSLLKFVFWLFLSCCLPKEKTKTKTETQIFQQQQNDNKQNSNNNKPSLFIYLVPCQKHVQLLLSLSYSLPFSLSLHLADSCCIKLYKKKDGKRRHRNKFESANALPDYGVEEWRDGAQGKYTLRVWLKPTPTCALT